MLIPIHVVRVSFAATPTEPTVGQRVRFESLLSGPVDSQHWDFNSDGVFDGTEPNPTHVYDMPGSYTVSLLIRGPGGEIRLQRLDYIHVLDTGDIEPDSDTGVARAYPLQRVGEHNVIDSGGKYWEKYETDDNLPGIYLSMVLDHLGDFLELHPDGTFYLEENGVGFSGVWERMSDDIKKWLRKSEQGDKWNRCLIEGMIVLSETGARDEQTTPP